MVLAGCAAGERAVDSAAPLLSLSIEMPVPGDVQEVVVTVDDALPASNVGPVPVEPVPADLSLADLVTASAELPAIRTSWGSDEDWATFSDALATTTDEYGLRSALRWHPGRQFDGWAAADIVAAVPAGEYTDPVFVFDDDSMGDSAGDELTILAVETGGSDRGRSVRIVLRELPLVEANLNLANMAFVEYVDNADEDGVFRGFVG